MMRRTIVFSVLAVLLTLAAPRADAAGKVTLENLLRQMTDLSLLCEFPDPSFVTKQFSSYDRASEKPGNDAWFANHDRGFMLYDGVVKEKTPYYKTGPQQGKVPDGNFEAGTKVGIAPNRKPVGDYVWVYMTGPDGAPVDGKIPQGYVAKSAITLDKQGHVLAEMDGPGCVVRIWSANPQDAGNIRIYLDGAEKPVIEAPMTELLEGKWQIPQPAAQARADAAKKWTPFPDPIACERSRGFNLYFPIAYARRCKITVDKPDIYYHVNYRSYSKGTEVTPFRMVDLARAENRLARIVQELSGPVIDIDGVPPPGYELKVVKHSALKPGAKLTAFKFEGPRKLFGLWVSLKNIKDEPEALRTLILSGRFDAANKPQVWCPLGDFFGSSPGANDYGCLTSHIRVIKARGAENEYQLGAFWSMPFEKNAAFEIHNLGKDPVSIGVLAHSCSYNWSSRSMHFHAKWRTATLRTRPFRDWTYCDLKGQGVFVGDMLSVLNPVPAWWGEGDEKIYVDGEKFPSWFGTGTEDYYGYAWSDPKPFQHAYHNQTRCDGPGTKGWTSVNRFHILDCIPFTKSFRFDMEVWHWTPNIDIPYAATSYWYARPGGTDDFKEVDAKVLQNIPQLPPPYQIKGAIEGEKLKILKKSSEFDAGPQDMTEFADGKWSGDSHLWVRPPKKGDWVDLELPVPADGKYHLIVYLTKARDYGIVQFQLDGRAIGKPIDCYHSPKVIATGAIDLGVMELKKGNAVLRGEVVGTNEKSVGLRYMWGLDCVVLKPE